MPRSRGSEMEEMAAQTESSVFLPLTGSIKDSRKKSVH